MERSALDRAFCCAEAAANPAQSDVIASRVSGSPLRGNEVKRRLLFLLLLSCLPAVAQTPAQFYVYAIPEIIGGGGFKTRITITNLSSNQARWQYDEYYQSGRATVWDHFTDVLVPHGSTKF